MYIQSIQAIPPLGCVQAIKNCTNKYCTFAGRARRSEYWYFVIISSIIIMIPIILISITIVLFVTDNTDNKQRLYGPNEDQNSTDYNNNDSNNSLGIGVYIIIFIAVIVEIILIIPLISATVRRLHDSGRSGCYYFLSFIPLLDILLLVFLLEDSQQNINEYGSSPKYILIQEGSLINNSLSTPQVVEGIPAPAYEYTQGNPQANPYQQFPQYPQVNMQPNLYQEPNDQFPSNQDLLVNPVASP